MCYDDKPKLLREMSSLIRSVSFRKPIFDIMPNVAHDKVGYNFETLISDCQSYKVSIIFGNLGRHLQTLDALINVFFSSDVKVGIISRFHINSPYRTKPQTPVDILFVLEPYIGQYAVLPENVRKCAIYLTSHAVLSRSNDVPVYFFYVSPPNVTLMPKYDCNLVEEDCFRFKPPVFYDANWKPLKRNVQSFCLDLTRCGSADEAYLRYLTGKEMIYDRRCKTFMILMSPRDLHHLKILLPKEEIKFLFKIKWINSVFFSDVFEQC